MLTALPRFSVQDTIFKNGSPGIGFYVTTSGINQTFGLTNFSASDSGGVIQPTPTPSAHSDTAGSTWNNWKAQLLNSVDAWIRGHPPVPD